MNEIDKDINALGYCIDLLQKHDDKLRQLMYKVVPFELEKYYEESKRIRICISSLMTLRTELKSSKLRNIVNKEN